MVAAGAATLTVAPVDASSTTLPVTLEAGGVYTVLVLQRDGALSAAVRLDARGSAVVPNGGVETGFGGTSRLEAVALTVRAGLLPTAQPG